MKTSIEGNRINRLTHAYYTLWMDAKDAMNESTPNDMEGEIIEQMRVVFEAEYRAFWSIREAIRAGYMPVRESE